MHTNCNIVRGLSAASARDVLRACRMLRRLELLADAGYRDPLYCNSRAALWNLVEAGWQAIARRNDSRGTLALVRRIVADGCAVVYQGRTPRHFDRVFPEGPIPLRWIPPMLPGTVGEWTLDAPAAELRAAA